MYCIHQKNKVGDNGLKSWNLPIRQFYYEQMMKEFSKVKLLRHFCSYYRKETFRNHPTLFEKINKFQRRGKKKKTRRKKSWGLVLFKIQVQELRLVTFYWLIRLRKQMASIDGKKTGYNPNTLQNVYLFHRIPFFFLDTLTEDLVHCSNFNLH